MSTQSSQEHIVRPPVVAIMGHVDHGKSTLLDFIRKSNIVDGEAGGITQHIAAYEVAHKNEAGENKRITFIDTPGHAAFSGMRNRGAHIADIAVLLVSAEDSVKAQTIEAINIIKEHKVPFLVAINKIDKPNANPEKVKADLMEHQIFLEGYGGDTPYAEISAKQGIGVPELLETILLIAELEEFTGSVTAPATGFVVESDMDQQRGTSATLILKSGVVHRGEFIVVNGSIASTRIIEDFLGKPINEAICSSPIIVTGFDTLPEVGARFEVCLTKKEAEKKASEYTRLAEEIAEAKTLVTLKEGQVLIPIVLKTDVAGTAEAIEGEIAKLTTEHVIFKIIKKDVGSINESDVRVAQSDELTIILGFHVDRDKKIESMNGIENVSIMTFDIIYKMIEWLEEEREVRRMRKATDVVTGSLKILKVFSSQKTKHVIGGRVETGSVRKGDLVKIMRREHEIGRGKIMGLQQGKAEVTSINQDNECGLMIDSKFEPAAGDIIEAFEVIIQ
jgi:translation initiation factor IF-2